MELKSYESPEMEIVLIANTDVIITSPSMGGNPDPVVTEPPGWFD